MGKIITVGREFGSGGREIGRKLAEKLRFAYYDHEIVVEIAKRTDLATEYIQSVEMPELLRDAGRVRGQVRTRTVQQNA